MKNKYVVIGLALFLVSLKSNSPEDIVELSIKFVDGYGNFQPGFAVLGQGVPSDNPWSKTIAQNLKGIPKDWADIVVNYVWFDVRQFAFQSYKQGMLSEEFFKELQTSWNINLDKRPFSDEPIKCFVYLIYGMDNNGVTKYKVDTNNNLDFSDDTDYSPIKIDWGKLDSLADKFSHSVKYESFRDGKVVELTAPLLILSNGKGSLLRNISQHGETELNGTKIFISSSGFTSTDYEPASICKLDSRDELINEKEFIVIGNHIYQNLGVNIDKQVLRLKKQPKDTVIYSSQVGFNAIPFTVKEFTTRENLSLDLYKGKFLYMEFWGSWCGPCLKELPEIKKAFNGIDKSKIDFLGIAFDKAEPLKKLLEKEKIEWKQIMREDEDGIIEDYNISSYPTSFLINPNGKIIAKNLRGKKLLDTLNYYTNRK